MSRNLIEMIDSYAESNGDRISYNYNGRQNTYRELKTDSDALAEHIDAMALKLNQPIIVFGEKSFEMIVAFLGAVKSGHPYIPVDVNSPSDRLKLINEIAQPAAVIAVSPLPITLPGVEVITNEELERICLEKVTYHNTHSVHGDQTFYIIFTSGTTGVPKGVEIRLCLQTI